MSVLALILALASLAATGCLAVVLDRRLRQVEELDDGLFETVVHITSLLDSATEDPEDPADPEDQE